MKQNLRERVLAAIGSQNYRALKPKALARKLKISDSEYPEFRALLKTMISKGELETAAGRAIGPARAHDEILGVYRGIRAGGGFVRPKPGQGLPTGDVFVRAQNTHDAASGDVVLVKITRKSTRGDRGPEGKILEVVERASNAFVGTYHVVEGEGLVRVDGGIFHERIYVGDPGAKGASEGDKVVFEMLRFPSPDLEGEGVITEVLGPKGSPGVDLLSVVRQFNLPDAFSPEALAEARQQAKLHEDEMVPEDRLDLTGETIVTIDPTDARDFDDAISLDRDENGHWRLGVHIADVSAFVRPNGPLDHEARRRGTSVYLPGRVIPMLPELISNGLASLQEKHLRYTKSVFIQFDPEGRITGIDFANSAIRVTKRLTYEVVMELFEDPEKFHGRFSAKVRALLGRMRELARILRERRRRRGFMELSMPSPELEYDDKGRITGAHYSVDDESHQLIEEFMVTANEAVASKLKDEGILFLRRIHEIPDPLKLKAFAQFAKSLGITIEDYRSRFELQRVLKEVAESPRRHAVNYALLRSLREAQYSPEG
ncbi:MAG: ribonuclease R family protein [Planctomycetota bacterium]